MLNQPCIAGINPARSCCMILFTCCGICFASVFVEDFVEFSLVKICSFFVFGDVFVWFVNR